MSEPLSGLTVFGSNTTGTTTQLDNNFTTLKTAVNDFNTYKNYLVDTGAANAYVVALPANITGLISDGLQIQVKLTNPNSGASVLNYNSTGNANIVNMDGSVLAANQIAANMIGILQYSNAISAWMLQTPLQGNNTVATGNQMIAGTSNTVVVAPGTLVYANQSSKFAVRFNGNNNATINVAMGVSNVQKSGTGNYLVTLSSNFSNAANMVIVATVGKNTFTGHGIWAEVGFINAGNFRVTLLDASQTLTDQDIVNVVGFGIL